MPTGGAGLEAGADFGRPGGEAGRPLDPPVARQPGLAQHDWVLASLSLLGLLGSRGTADLESQENVIIFRSLISSDLISSDGELLTVLKISSLI